MIRFLLVAALLPATASAYYGSYDPSPFRSRAHIKVIDTMTPNVECAKQMNPLFAPVAIATIMGCTNSTFSQLVASVTPSPFWAHIVAHGLTTPQGIIGHEFRHIFDGAFHGVLPFTDRLQYADADRRKLLDQQHGSTVLVERCGDAHCFRVLGDTEEADCVFYTRTEAVSYFDMGRLFQACWEAVK